MNNRGSRIEAIQIDMIRDDQDLYGESDRWQFSTPPPSWRVNLTMILDAEGMDRLQKFMKHQTDDYYEKAEDKIRKAMLL